MPGADLNNPSRRILAAQIASLACLALAGCKITNRTPQVATAEPAPLHAIASLYGIEPLSYSARRDGGHLLPTVYMSAISREFHRQVVNFRGSYTSGTIVINNDSRHLYLVLNKDHAIRYGVSVGAEGMTWRGEGEIYMKKSWPSWTPTASMIQRDAALLRYSSGMPGGNRNPLGARALYIRSAGKDEGYRIHGTPNWRSIGHYASSGCIRMVNQDVIDLYDRIKEGGIVLSI